MKRIITTIALAGVLLVPTAALAGDGTCEVDGEAGLSTAWGECVTPSVYDDRFSFEALSNTPLLGDPEVSVAEAYGIVAPDVASDRLLGAGLVEDRRTFKQFVTDSKVYS